MAGATKVLSEDAGTVWVKPEDGGITMVSFSAGDEVPAWAAKQMGDHCFSEADDEADAGNEADYASMKKADLEAEVASRNEGRADDDAIVVEAPGNKAELIAALEADDEADTGS